ncbi:MAG TPA: extracellular solute-binding protein [Aestuariivirgaceae bacterium]|nr:extracellular solute-binding protein [Aestuariivirgaceae bacterium]
MEEFRKLTGIGVDNIQDISIFDIPQRAMAEALSRSPEFDFFHVDAGMIPSLASAGLIEPLDGYMKKASFKIDAVGTYDRLFVYKGQTYGVPTDGNIHTQYIRGDLLNDPTERKRFEDKNSMPAKWPETWEDEFRLMKHFHNPDKGIWGSGNLRNRANGVTWWLMKFYSAGGFPFDNDMNPTINTPAGQYAVEVYLREKEVAHPESPGWGTPQMIPRITGGNVFACQYWDGTIRLNENPEKSKTAGKWEYGLVPGSTKSGKLLHRSISSPLAAVLVNKYSPRKEAAAYLALWWGSLKASEQITSDRVHTFHDAWHKGHMTSELVKNAYTPAGLKAVEKNLQVACPPIYLTGYLEFQDQLSKNLSEAYVGQLKADEVLKRTEEEWSRTIKRTGVAKLKEELATYRNALPQIDKPA